MPQGNLAGHGIGVGDQHGFPESFFEEHGFIIGLMSILPRAEYFQGLPKMWQRPTRLDYYWPDFAELGEQAVLNKELYLETASAAPVNSNSGQPLVVKNASTGATLVSQAGFTSDASGFLKATTAGVTSRLECSDGTVGSVLVSELRKANALQRFMEKMSRGGARLTEVILMQFGVKSSDARLQRPEYLGGARSPITISEVTSTYQLNVTPPNLPRYRDWETLFLS